MRTHPAGVLCVSFAILLITCGCGSQPGVASVEATRPSLTSVSPDSTTAGTGAVLMKISGTGFTAGTVAEVDGRIWAPLATSATQLEFVLPQTETAIGHVASVVVRNPARVGGGVSDAKTFTVNNPAPVLTRTPAAVLAEESATVRVTGEYFDKSAAFTVNGVAVQAEIVSATEADVTVPAQAAGNFVLSVSTPAPGGGSVTAPLWAVHTGAIAATTHPLVARVRYSLPAGTKVWAEFGADTRYGRRTSEVISAGEEGRTEMLVAGMRASTAYHVRSHFEFADGTEVCGEDELFTTGAVAEDRVPVVKITQMDGVARTDGVELLDMVNGTDRQLRAAVFDLDGGLIWYYDYPLDEGQLLPIKPMSNGHFGMVITRNKQLFREVDLEGVTVREITAAEINAQLAQRGSAITVQELHHDFLELPDDRLVLLASDARTVAGVAGFRVLGDVLIVVDRDGQVVWTWSSFDHLDGNRWGWKLPLFGQLPFPVWDWTHSNAVIHSERDGSLLISMRHQSWVLKIDYADGLGDGHVIWRLGPGGDFALLGDTDATDWFYDQHFPVLLDDTSAGMTIALLDNGNQRPKVAGDAACNPATECYSRAVVLRVIESAKTAEITWNARTTFSNFGGEIAPVGPGRIEYTLSSVPGWNGGAVVESTMDTSPVEVWRLDVKQYLYRGMRLPSLYPGVSWEN